MVKRRRTRHPALKAYHNCVTNARKRNIQFLLTFEEWWEWWQTDNRWERRGRGPDKLNMCRIGDEGAYRLDNIYCATHEQNQADIPHAKRIAVGITAHQTRKARGNRIALEMRGSGHPRSRPIRTPLGDFESGRLAAEAHGLTPTTLYDRVKSGASGYLWLDGPNRESENL